MKALKYYSVYLGRPELFDQMRKRANLRWKPNRISDTALRILTKDSVNEALAYLSEISSSDIDDRYKQVVFLAAETGIRAKEIFLLSKLKDRIPVSNGFYECFRSKEFLRRSKNLFIVYHDEVIEKRLEEVKKATRFGFMHAVKRAGLGSKLQVLRDAWANLLLRNGLAREEVDILQGRVGQSIFVRYYFTVNKKRLYDEVSKVVSEIREKIKN